MSVLITSKSSISALGFNKERIWERYHADKHHLSICCFNDSDTPTARISESDQQLIDALRKETPHYRKLDKSVLMSILTAREVIKQSAWTDLSNVGINVGSSRGATQLFEKYHQHFIQSPNKRMSPMVSPTTTLGNISSWVAYDLGLKGISLSHSITCSSALHSILNAYVWIKSGQSDQFIAGGSEAPLTDFTVAQMRALGIYSQQTTHWYCQPFKDAASGNTMILGEGAALFSLEKDNGQKALAKIIGIGYATEHIEHAASLSAEADCLQKSMNMALKNIDKSEVDVIVMHAPGTLQGDESELAAVESVFEKQMPHLISTKHHSGHTLGASGGISLDLAIEMIQRQSVVSFPYPNIATQKPSIVPKTVLVNAVGFGGNAVSITIQKAD